MVVISRLFLVIFLVALSSSRAFQEDSSLTLDASLDESGTSLVEVESSESVDQVLTDHLAAHGEATILSRIEEMLKAGVHGPIDGLVKMLENIRKRLLDESETQRTKWSNRDLLISQNIAELTQQIAASTTKVQDFTNLIAAKTATSKALDNDILALERDINGKATDLQANRRRYISSEAEFKTSQASLRTKIAETEQMLELLKTVLDELNNGNFVEQNAATLIRQAEHLQDTTVKSMVQTMATLAALSPADDNKNDANTFRALLAKLTDELKAYLRQLQNQLNASTKTSDTSLAQLEAEYKSLVEAQQSLKVNQAEKQRQRARALQDISTNSDLLTAEKKSLQQLKTTLSNAQVHRQDESNLLRMSNDSRQKQIDTIVRLMNMLKAKGELRQHVADRIGNITTTFPFWETGAWGACSAQCGRGVQTRSVVCKNADDKNKCSMSPPASSMPCFQRPCKVDCQVSAWGEWSACSVPSCGRGTKSRQRTIVTRPRYGGAACPALKESAGCEVPCPECLFYGLKASKEDWTCPPGFRMPGINEEAAARACVNVNTGNAPSFNYHHDIAVAVGGCGCKWSANWCTHPSIETFNGRMCGDFSQYHVCLKN